MPPPGTISLILVQCIQYGVENEEAVERHFMDHFHIAI